MYNFPISIGVGLLFHWFLKYCKAPTWDIRKWTSNDKKYLWTSASLCVLLAIFGPAVISMIVSMLPISDNVQAAINAAPGFVGFVLGASGGSLAYNLPFIGGSLKDVFGWQQDREMKKAIKAIEKLDNDAQVPPPENE